LTILVGAILFAFLPIGEATLQEDRDHKKFRRAERPIPGRYIVVFEDWAAGARGADRPSRRRSLEAAKQ